MVQRSHSLKHVPAPPEHRVLSVGDWKYHLTSRRFWCSEEALELFGLNEDSSLSAFSLLRYVHPDDQSLIFHCWKEIAAARIIGGLTFRIVLGSEERYIYASVKTEYDNGEIIAVYGTIRDVTPVMKSFRLQNSVEKVLTSEAADYDVPFILLDRHNRVVRMNHAAEELFGWRELEVLYHELPHIPSLYTVSMQGVYKVLMTKGGFVRFDTLRIAKDGTPRHVGVVLETVVNSYGRVIGIAGYYTDTFEQNYGQKLLSEIEQQLRALFQNSTDVCLILSLDDEFTYVSPSVENVLGYTPEEYSRLPLSECIHPDDFASYERVVQELKRSPQTNSTLQVQFRHKDGKWRHCSARIRYLSEYSGMNGIIMNLNDISETVRAQELIHHVAYYDALTGLPNRRLFEERLAMMIGLQAKQQEKLAVLRIEVNRLKYIKNNLGIDELDLLVKEIAVQLEGLMPKGAIIARTGESEFSALIPVVKGSQQSIRVARAITHLFDGPFAVSNYHVRATCAVGISMYPDDGRESVQLLHAADIACTEARELGKNRIQVHTARLNAKTFKEISLAHDFQEALKNDDFMIYYQPRISTKTDEIVGAEALLRWNHADWGVLTPAEFLHLAEETGTLVSLGESVLRKVCRQIQQWTEKGFPEISVSVNLSAEQLMEEDIVGFVATLLAEYDVRPNRLEIEITETSILPNDPVITQSIRALRRLGIKVYFDDFGTGYSSLNWLYQFELDGIKLDKVFIDDIPHQPVPTEIVESIIRLAHGLKLEVVAEGVETRDQLDFLREKLCDEIQGYFFSRALPTEEFETVLTRGFQNLQDLYSPLPDVEERRRYHRIDLPYPLIGGVAIDIFKRENVEMGYSEILISDVGAGGLRFVTRLRLPKSREVVLRFQMRILQQDIEVTGTVVWSKELPSELFEYGIEFLVDDLQRLDYESLFRRFEDELAHWQAPVESGESEAASTLAAHSRGGGNGSGFVAREVRLEDQHFYSGSIYEFFMQKT